MIYQNGSWFFSRSVSLPRANRAANFLEKFGDFISTDNELPAYKLIHLLSPHGPWTTGADCSPSISKNIINESIYNQTKCITRAVMVFIDTLKQKGIFNKSLIVVHGDHGICSPDGLPTSRIDNVNIPKCIGNVQPLVLIKLPNAANIKLITSEKKVSLIDLPATILDAWNIPHQVLGSSLIKNSNRFDAKRIFYNFEPNRTLAFKRIYFHLFIDMT